MENWAGAMTAARFLQLYPDPKEHFTGEARNKVVMVPEYSEHTLADLLLRFPYQARTHDAPTPLQSRLLCSAWS